MDWEVCKVGRDGDEGGEGGERWEYIIYHVSYIIDIRYIIRRSINKMRVMIINV